MLNLIKICRFLRFVWFIVQFRHFWSVWLCILNGILQQNHIKYYKKLNEWPLKIVKEKLIHLVFACCSANNLILLISRKSQFLTANFIGQFNHSHRTNSDCFFNWYFLKMLAFTITFPFIFWTVFICLFCRHNTFWNCCIPKKKMRSYRLAQFYWLL